MWQITWLSSLKPFRHHRVGLFLSILALRRRLGPSKMLPLVTLCTANKCCQLQRGQRRPSGHHLRLHFRKQVAGEGIFMSLVFHSPNPRMLKHPILSCGNRKKIRFFFGFDLPSGYVRYNLFVALRCDAWSWKVKEDCHLVSGKILLSLQVITVSYGWNHNGYDLLCISCNNILLKLMKSYFQDSRLTVT